MRAIFRFAACLVLPCASVVADIAARVAHTYTENLGRASGPADFRDASTYDAEVVWSHARQLESGLLLRPQLFALAAHTPDFDLLDTAELGGRVVVQKKFGLGPTAPVLAADATISGRTARIDEADAVVTRAGITFSKRFNPDFAVNLRGEAGRDWARDDLFEVTTRDVVASAVFDPHARLRLTAGVGHRRGTFVAGASGARFAGALAGALGPEIASYYGRVPQITTNAFEPGWLQYRVRGEADYWFFDLAPALTDRTSLSVRYERVASENIVNVGYQQDIFRVAILHVF